MLKSNFKERVNIMKKISMKATICILLFVTISLMCSFTTAKAGQIKDRSQAKEAALKKVPSATVVEIDTDREDGNLIYEVELYKSGKEYNLMYLASNGKLMEYSWEVKNTPNTNQNKKSLTKKQIKKKALKKVKGATVKNVVLTHDDGIEQYKVWLKKGSKKYDLVYNSKTGKLLEYEWEIIK